MGVKVAFSESYETNPHLFRLAFLRKPAWLCEWCLPWIHHSTTTSPRLWEMNILLESWGSGGEDLLKRQTYVLMSESILLQYGLPPNLETKHILLTQEHLL